MSLFKDQHEIFAWLNTEQIRVEFIIQNIFHEKYNHQAVAKSY